MANLYDLYESVSCEVALGAGVNYPFREALRPL